MEEANAAMKEPPKVVLRCKLCMVGDAAVGKTALTEVYTKGGSKFPKNYSMVRWAEVRLVSDPCGLRMFRPSRTCTAAQSVSRVLRLSPTSIPKHS